MNRETSIGMNRTGIGTSPVHAKELIEAAQTSTPTSTGDAGTLAAVRMLYARDAEPVGTVPPPTTLKGAAATVVQLLKGQKMSVLLDKLGERLAFERTGTRLYEAVLAKIHIDGSWEGGPTPADLQQIRDEELGHFEMLLGVIAGIGGDPTAQTPSADIVGVQSMGLVQVVSDARTSLAQSLCAIQVAELTDNDGWDMLIQLAESLGQDEMAGKFRAALVTEERHLELVREWVSSYTLAEGAREVEKRP